MDIALKWVPSGATGVPDERACSTATASPPAHFGGQSELTPRPQASHAGVARLSPGHLKRRRWDLNPRTLAGHTISNRADSAALALLQMAFARYRYTCWRCRAQ